jgi:hypothetical protein
MEFAVVAGAARQQASRAAPAGAAGRHEAMNNGIFSHNDIL